MKSFEAVSKPRKSSKRKKTGGRGRDDNYRSFFIRSSPADFSRSGFRCPFRQAVSLIHRIHFPSAMIDSLYSTLFYSLSLSPRQVYSEGS